MSLNAYCFEQNTGFASSSYLSIVCALKLINQDKSQTFCYCLTVTSLITQQRVDHFVL